MASQPTPLPATKPALPTRAVQAASVISRVLPSQCSWQRNLKLKPVQARRGSRTLTSHVADGRLLFLSSTAESFFHLIQRLKRCCVEKIVTAFGQHYS